MKVKELVDILKTISNQDAKIMVQDTAAGFRDIDIIEDVLNHQKVYVIHTKRKKR